MQLFAVAPVRAVVGLVLAVGGSAGSAGSWSVQATPNPAGAASSYLNAVACPSATVCTAVGNSITSSRTYATLAERWDGLGHPTHSGPARRHVDFPHRRGLPLSRDVPSRRVLPQQCGRLPPAGGA